MIPNRGKPEEMAPSMKSHEVHTDGKKRGGQIKQTKKEKSFHPSAPRSAANSLESERKNQPGEKKRAGRRVGGFRGHELDDLPCFPKVKSERSH